MESSNDVRKEKWNALLQRVKACEDIATQHNCQFHQLPKDIRKPYGKAVERAALEYLQACGLPLTETSEQLDKVDLLDLVLTHETGTLYGQTKFREPGRPHVGVELYCPFYGYGSQATRPGRDAAERCKYDFYVIYIGDSKGGMVYLIWGKAQKKVLRNTERTWVDAGCPSPYETKDVWFKFTTDQGSGDTNAGKPKVMAYIDPLVYLRGGAAVPVNEYLMRTNANYKDGLGTFFSKQINRWIKKDNEKQP